MSTKSWTCFTCAASEQLITITASVCPCSLTQQYFFYSLAVVKGDQKERNIMGPLHRNGWKILTAVFQWIHGLVCKNVAKTQTWTLPFCVKQSVSFCVKESVSFCVNWSVSFCFKQSVFLCQAVCVSFLCQAVFLWQAACIFLCQGICVFLCQAVCVFLCHAVYVFSCQAVCVFFLSNSLRFCVSDITNKIGMCGNSVHLVVSKSFFCSSLVKNVSPQLHPEELRFKTRSTSVPWYW